MFKPLLLGSAALFAMPLLAQTIVDTQTSAVAKADKAKAASKSTVAVKTPVATATNDHEPLVDDAAAVGSTGVYTQVNGGVTTSATAYPGTGTTATVDTTAGAVTDVDATSAGTDARTEVAVQPSASLAGQQTSWNFGGDWGEFGSANWGVDAMRGAQAGSQGSLTGMGGPIDVDAGWATYARAGRDDLDRWAFGTWILDANGHDVTTKLRADRRWDANPRTQILNATSLAWTQADLDRDGRVSRAEFRQMAGA
jgi:hypothetical protein